jgi:NAD-dependent SIR2 family protein deacetylase
MKYKDWKKQQDLPHPTRGNPIHCPDCGKLIGYDKDFQFIVLTTPIVCPDCDEIVIYPNITVYGSENHEDCV